MKTLTDYRAEVDAAVAEYKLAKRLVAEELKHLANANQKLQDAEQAREVLQTLARMVEEKAHAQIATVVTHAIRAGGWDYDFKIVFEEKRGKTEARAVFVRNGHELDPVTAAGHGPLDVAALALRLVSIMLSMPQKRRLLILDEPLKNVHGEEHRQKVAALVQALARDLQFQLVVATGLDWLQVGKVIPIGGSDE